jgi:hypothetical protein
LGVGCRLRDNRPGMLFPSYNYVSVTEANFRQLMVCRSHASNLVRWSWFKMECRGPEK